MPSTQQAFEVKHLFISSGHDFKGRHGLSRQENVITDQEEIELVAGRGILGDRYFDYEPDYKGQITFFEESVWLAIREKFSLPSLSISEFRRNVIVRGVEVNSLIGQRFAIGDLEFSGSEEAKPCYWMDEACAPGVEEFLRGQGGLRARILKGGTLAKGTSELRTLGPVG